LVDFAKKKKNVQNYVLFIAILQKIFIGNQSYKFFDKFYA